MKKDVHFPEVKGVRIAIAKKEVASQTYDWYVYLLNHNDYALKNILITSKGYGEKDGEEQKTSTLRQMIPSLDAHSYTAVERIDPSVFHLCNDL